MENNKIPDATGRLPFRMGGCLSGQVSLSGAPIVQKYFRQLLASFHFWVVVLLLYLFVSYR